MNIVRKSLTQYTNFIGDEAIPNHSLQASLKTDSIDNDRSSRFSRKASEFLEKWEKRKHNQLLELSRINIVEGNETHHQLNEGHLSNPQPT